MQWYHECDPEWLQARKKWLTASEVAKIIPVTATGRERKASTCKNNMLEVWSGKQAIVSDIESTGAAARGHVMEPYAIKAFNELYGKGSLTACHWDDAIIYNESLGIAFSPDGMDVSQDDLPGIEIDMRDLPERDINIFEVKSYSIDRHYQKGLANKDHIEERWQLAHAMAVSPRIKHAYLMFYNPNCPHQLFVHYYHRSHLEDEVKVILKAAKQYQDYANDIEARLTAKLIGNECFGLNGMQDEYDIIEEYKRSEDIA